jgi:hypothetical protein
MASKADKRSRQLLGNAAVENFVAIAYGGNWPEATQMDVRLNVGGWGASGLIVRSAGSGRHFCVCLKYLKSGGT